MSSQHNKTYIYDVGNKDQLRLKILNDTYNPMSQKALLAIGLQTKKCVIDVACGQGEMTCWIAKNIHPDGIVFGIDISEDQLQLARQHAQQQNLSNIFFIKKSLLDEHFGEIADQLPCKPDLIYSRWLLIHLEHEKIRQAMHSLYELLNTNGIIVHEEVTLKESYLDKTTTSFHQYVTLFTQLANELHINFDLGSDLKNLLTYTGYKQVQTIISKPKFSLEQLYFFPLDVESAIPALEKFNIAKEHEAQLLISNLQKDISNGFDMTMTNYITHGVK